MLESIEEIHFEEKVNDKVGEDIKETDKQEKTKNKREESQRQKKEPKQKSKKGIKSLSLPMCWQEKKNQVQIERQLKGEEIKKSLTLCEEVTYYEKTLAFSESMLCKDIPAYSLMKREKSGTFWAD